MKNSDLENYKKSSRRQTKIATESTEVTESTSLNLLTRINSLTYFRSRCEKGDIKELLESMERIPLLRYEVLVLFHKFKKENKGMMEEAMSEKKK